jgi:hypothetical protein
MMRKFYAFLLLLSIAYSGSLFAQSGAGELRGKVQDAKTKEGIPFAAVIVEQSGSQVAATQADFDGNFVIKPIQAGKYDVRVKIIGYNDNLVNGLIITSNKQTYQDFKMVTSVKNISEVTVSDYKKPLIEIDNTIAGGSLDAAEIVKLPTRNINSLVSTTAGVYQADEGSALSVKGSRTDANDYYIDGVKVRGVTNLPQGAIEQITVITGGVPAQYGDATGGIVTITTKGPSKKFNGGVEAVTSEFLDGFGYNLVSGNVSGPLVMKDKDTENPTPLIGYFASVELESRRDQDPSYVGAYKAQDNFLESVRTNPTQLSTIAGPTPSRSGIVRVPTTYYVRASDLDKVKAQDDNENRNLNFSARLDFQPNINNTFALGFNGTSQRQRVYNRLNMLFNSENNAVFTRNNFRVYGRYTQKFNQSTSESKSLLKNAYYTIQADFSRDNRVQEDINHRDRLFEYGYVGTYVTDRRNFRGAFDVNNDNTADTLLGSDGNSYRVSNLAFASTGGKVDSGMTFAPGTLNPYIAQYNTNLINYINDQEALAGSDLFTYTNASSFNTLTGILNGGTPQQIYGGLFNVPGTISNLYDVNNSDQYRVTAMASADLKGHAIQIGIEYEQRIESRFRINPRGLWTIMRQQQNAYLKLDESAIDATNLTLDVTNPSVTLAGDGSTFFLATENNYNDATTLFAQNIRTKLGLNPGDFVDIDSYDPSTFSLDMFSATNLIDLFNPVGLAYTYNGYTFDGKKTNDNITMEDFLDPANVNTRPIGAFRPIYTAGYIQDKFTFKDIVFNLGIRVDRFDANQQVLKDKYSLYETRTAGELASRPSNIPADAAVYVDEPNSASNVRGYRSGDVFYDANGNVVQNINEIRSLSNGRPTPWLASSALDTANRPVLSSGAFKDYEPQTQIMPRIAFSFPISDVASFFANYDVLTQRPRSNVFSNPITYYLQSLGRQGQVIISPDLKPEKTINYQFGFKQKVGLTSAITLTAFYKELKDNFQQVQIATAYPTAYLTYENRDFGTIKGFTLQYDLRRTNNIQVNAAYTLQFANGTGSDANSAANLISSGESEPIRIALPLDYDQRHTLVTTIDYRYGSGSSYTGPANMKKILENAGLNLIFRAGSGTPYSRISQNVVQNILSADDTRFRTLIGEINGSRLPWQYNIDVRIDKDIAITSKNAEGKGRNTTLNVYLLVQNLFDTERIANVYPATGLPDDDGFLASSQSVDFLNGIGTAGSIDSYIDLYKIRVNDPNNFRLPRVIRLGAIYNF